MTLLDYIYSTYKSDYTDLLRTILIRLSVAQYSVMNDMMHRCLLTMLRYSLWGDIIDCVALIVFYVLRTKAAWINSIVNKSILM